MNGYFLSSYPMGGHRIMSVKGDKLTYPKKEVLSEIKEDLTTMFNLDGTIVWTKVSF